MHFYSTVLLPVSKKKHATVVPTVPLLPTSILFIPLMSGIFAYVFQSQVIRRNIYNINHHTGSEHINKRNLNDYKLHSKKMLTNNFSRM